MVPIHVRYDGQLGCTAEHGPSQARLQTDAPLDNQGKGASFSPTDLVATGLGTCMLTTMAIVARRKGYRIEGCELRVEKHMTAVLPRRIERLAARLTAPSEIAAGLHAEARALLEHTARTCPVALSLSPEITLELQFRW
jgi:putative redox protein